MDFRKPSLRQIVWPFRGMKVVCGETLEIATTTVFFLDTDDLAATFREPFSYMQIGVDWRNDWNNNIDASDVALEFLTTSASGVIVFARGTISGDFLQIRLMGRTRARATMNLGLYKHEFLPFLLALY